MDAEGPLLAKSKTLENDTWISDGSTMSIMNLIKNLTASDGSAAAFGSLSKFAATRSSDEDETPLWRHEQGKGQTIQEIINISN